MDFLLKQMDSFLDKAKEYYLQDKEVTPVAFFLTKKGREQEKIGKKKPFVGLAPMRFENPAEKRKMFATLGAMIKTGAMAEEIDHKKTPDELEELIFISEVWVKRAKKGEQLTEGKMPSEYEDRQEAIMAIYRNKEGKVLAKGVEIIKKGDKIEFKDMGTPDKTGELKDSLLFYAFNPIALLEEMVEDRITELKSRELSKEVFQDRVDELKAKSALLNKTIN